MDITCLIKKIHDTINPIVIADNLGYFIAESLKNGDISIYEAYVLNFEEIKFRRIGYTKAAWSGEVYISTCLDILNQKLLADVFEEKKNAELLKNWGLEAYNLIKKRRSHYILDKYPLFLENHCFDLLETLIEVRRNYNKLNHDDGPYHISSFPGLSYSPEEALLDDNLKKRYNEKKNLSDAIEDLIVELNLQF